MKTDLMTTPFPAVNRRRFLVHSAIALAATGASRRWVRADQAEIASIFDPVMESFIQERGMPGGALAVVRGGELIHAKGYGWADRDKALPATPESLFRIASLSKPITAVSILKLIQEERLAMKTLPFELLNLYEHVPSRQTLDERWRQVTVQHLLQHTGGWDRSVSFDPMFRPGQIARALEAPSPAGPWSVIRYMLGRPLDFAPGARYAYSNFGYCLLGRVIEQVTGQRYEAYVRANILAPLGIRSARLGESRRNTPGEVSYYMPSNETAPSVFHPHDNVPWPNGGFNLEAMDAHGGWIASVVDLARFAHSVGPEGKLLRQATYDSMLSRPNADGEPAPTYYGCGWQVRPVGEGCANCWHTGSLPGTYSFMVRRHDEICYVALFNQRSAKRRRDGEIDSLLYNAADRLS